MRSEAENRVKDVNPPLQEIASVLLKKVEDLERG